MKLTSHVTPNLPNIDNPYSISFLCQCLIIVLKLYTKSMCVNSGTLLVTLLDLSRDKNKAGKTEMKMSRSGINEKGQIRRTIKREVILFMALAMLIVPSGICSQQHLIPAYERQTIVLPEQADWQQMQLQVAALAFRGFESALQLDDTFDPNPRETNEGKKVPAPPFHEYIMRAAQAYEVDPALIRAIILAESSYNPQAVSNRGARGLMQLMPTTARSLGVLDSFDPAMNIDGGVRYFKLLLDRFQGDVSLALAAYNAGSRYVRKYGGVPPFRATRDYIKKVLRYQKKFRNEMAVNTSTEPAA